MCHRAVRGAWSSGSHLWCAIRDGAAVQTTDPTRINSGSQFAALLAATPMPAPAVMARMIAALGGS
jgi:hypothetical protein